MPRKRGWLLYRIQANRTGPTGRNPVHTIQLQDLAPLPDDQALLRALFKVANLDPGAGLAGKLGILNVDAQIYRAIKCDDLQEEIRLTGCLANLKFTLIPARGIFLENGYALVFDRVPVTVVPSFRPSGHRSRRRSSF
jgi:hypothetical protein